MECCTESKVKEKTNIFRLESVSLDKSIVNMCNCVQQEVINRCSNHQGGRSWQPFGERKKSLQNFRQARIFYCTQLNICKFK